MRLWWCCVIAFVLTLHLPNSAAQTPRIRNKTKPRTAPTTRPAADHLSTAYYAKSCPNLEAIVNQKVNAWIKRDSTIAPSIIRLHFHDCAVRGCDASVLLNHRGSERSAHASKTLRGFTLIDEIKAEVERRCPRTVSCADILTAAARDATILAGGPFWEVPFGRKDGRVSLGTEANLVPQGHDNITSLIGLFQKLGLNIVDLVVLSGAHTIGRSSCSSIQQRFSNFNGTRKFDPSIDINYLSSLKRQCKLGTNFVNLDVTSPRTFDVAYYTNLEKKLGLLSTDQLLHSDSRTSPLVDALASQAQLFTSQFAVSMVKLGNVRVLTGKMQGEIRRNCNFVNS
ncbi:peroxidase 7-like [Olea europaea var. sylvestris]|uniref:peroxidase 7-like n=1 Tax=Olea europaea var. sylvestris TaxID=158386 RepID=UPI000C1D021A|nr:peroxidase 7-like [Olea europaea var. sylvestris]